MSDFLVFPQPGVSPKHSFFPWLIQAQAVLAATGTRRDGFLGAVLVPEQYAAFQQRRAFPVILVEPQLLVYLPLEDPGLDFRVRFPQRAPLAYTELEESNLRDRFKAETAAYREETTTLAKAVAQLIASISPTAQDAASGSRDGFMGCSLITVINRMTLKFGRLTADELMAAQDSLSHPWDSGDIAAHLAKHRRIHELLLANVAAIPEVFKIGALQRSLGLADAADASSPFRPVFLAYQTRVPVVANRSFADIAIDIESAGESLAPPTTFAAAAQVKTKPAARRRDDGPQHRIQSGPLVFCSHHGDNKTHITAHCQVLARRAAAAK